MRIIFHNPHVNIWYKTPLYFYLTKRKSYNKYEYLLDYCINNNVEFAFWVDGLDFSFGRSFLKGTFLARLELFFWRRINKLNSVKIKTISNVDQLMETDVVYSFLYGNFTNYHGAETQPAKRQKLIENFKRCKAKKVVNLTHYMFNAKTGSENTREAGVDLFVAENNLSANSDFFRSYFGWYKENVFTLPFLAQPRFQVKTAYQERKNKAVATGTLMFDITDPDFLDYFKNGQLHPMRKAIYENKEAVTDQVDSYIHKMENTAEITKSSTNIFQKIANFYHVNFKAKQAQYFSFNIVDLYNSYKMFVVPEEVIGLPGIGFIEGMSCGTVLIGKHDAMYTDLGMISGVNYIGYNGTLDELVDKIKYYQDHQDELQLIAENSIKFVKEKMQPGVVAKAFIERLNKW